jgi:hypothetical protein
MINVMARQARFVADHRAAADYPRCREALSMHVSF